MLHIGRSCQNINDPIEDPMAPAKLMFFSFVARILQPILVKYQSDKPMVPYMYQNLFKLLRKLIQLIVKPDIVANCSSAINLKSIDLDDENMIMTPKDMNTGFGMQSIITELKRKDVIINTNS